MHYLYYKEVLLYYTTEYCRPESVTKVLEFGLRLTQPYKTDL